MHKNHVFFELFKKVVVKKADENELIKMIQSGEYDLSHIPLIEKDDGRGYLIRAVQYGLKNVIEALLDARISAKTTDPLTNMTALHYLVTKQNTVVVTPDIIQRLMSNGADINALDYSCRTPLVALLESILKEDTDEQRKQKEDLAKYLIDLASLDGAYGALALTAAINSQATRELLISKGVSINGVFEKGIPHEKTLPLLKATTNCDPELVQEMLANGATVEGRIGDFCIASTMDKTASSQFDDSKKDQIKELLLSHGAENDAVDRYQINRRLFDLINFRGDPDVPKALKILKRENVDVNLPVFKQGFTLLHSAANGGESEVIEELIKQGADVNALTIEGDSPLHLMMKVTPTVQNIERLVQAGANINQINQTGFTPIHNLNYSKYTEPDELNHQIESLSYLLDKGARLSGIGGTTLLCNWIASTEAAKIIIDKSIDLDGIGKRIPIEAAAYCGNSQIFFYLQSKGVDSKSRALRIAQKTLSEGDRREEREAIFASVLPHIHDVNEILEPEVENRLLNYCATGNFAVPARQLLERGADQTLANKNGLTPIMQAMNYKCYEAAAILIEHGANIKGEAGAYLLMMAIDNKSLPGVKLLIENRLDVNSTSKGMTPLQQAVKDSQVAIVRSLLEAGANPNLQGDNEPYPLAIAIKKGHELIVHLLLLAGADASLAIDKKSTLATLASKSKNPAFTQMINLSMEELKNFKPHQKLLRFTNKRHLFAEGFDKWTDTIKAQIKAGFGKRTLESIQEDTGEIEYFDVIDESGKGVYQLMLFNYGDGCLFNFDKKTIVGNIVQHGFELEKRLSEDIELELREMLDDAYRNFEGDIRQSVNFSG